MTRPPFRLHSLHKRLALEYRRWREPIWHHGSAAFELAGERLAFTQADEIGWWVDKARRGRYEPAALEYFAGRIARGDVVFDIGAWIGAYSLVASRRVGDRGRVFAFEPNPPSRALLEANIELNGMENVTVVPTAVSDHPGKVWLRSERRGLSPRTISGTECADVEVEAVTLASFCAAHQVTPDVIKVDVEGAEAEVLCDEAAELARRARATVVEVHDPDLRARGLDPDEFLDRLSGWGLNVRELERRSRRNRTVSVDHSTPRPRAPAS